MRTSHAPHAQRGATLIMGLVLLALLLVLGISAVMVSNVQVKVSGNVQFQNLALSSAESGLAVAERWLTQLDASGLPNYDSTAFLTAGVSPGLYPLNSNLDPLTMTWTDANSIKVDGDSKRRYLIELYLQGVTLPSSSRGQCGHFDAPAPCPQVNVYRISARGTSQLGAAKIVQSLYTVRAITH